ncbi:LysR family transcriptional regulator, partial [Escherichia coli]|nr:LysR family transcriptional regulator [Escherichia coli]
RCVTTMVRLRRLWGRLRERAKSYAKALANDILR